MAVKVDEGKCSGCGECTEICPREAILLAGGTMLCGMSELGNPIGTLSMGAKAYVYTEKCDDCGICIDKCPEGALSLA